MAVLGEQTTQYYRESRLQRTVQGEETSHGSIGRADYTILQGEQTTQDSIGRADYTGQYKESRLHKTV